MTGTYHLPIYRAFRKAGFDTRIVHPFASSHYRLAEHGDVKTDDNDLVAIFRAAVNGFGLLEKEWSDVYRRMQILSRHRRDLVKKRSKLQCQIRHYLERCLPGYANLFPYSDLWKHATAVTLLTTLAEHGGTADTLVEAGVSEVCQWLRTAGCRFQSRTVERVVAWASNAATGDPQSDVLRRVWLELLDDWREKKRQIQQLERDLASVLVQTPYVLLLSHPGINVVSAAELAGETGPIEHYASAKAISGRAGLFPSRYQSDEVDRGGNLSRFRNGRMRSAWLLVADNVVKYNGYWRGKSELWRSQGHAARDIRCRVANRITRSVFSMIFGRKLYQHPSRLDRGYVMDKLLTFHREHETTPAIIVRDLEHAAQQIPKSDHAEEAAPLRERQIRSQRSRRREAQDLGTLLVAVLARLGVGDLESD